MVFHLKNKGDVLLVLVVLLIFNIIEYLIPSRITSVSAYIIGALSFISIIEILQYFVKRKGYVVFFLLIIGLVLIFHFLANYVGLPNTYVSRPYLYGTYAGFVLSIILRLFNTEK